MNTLIAALVVNRGDSEIRSRGERNGE